MSFFDLLAALLPLCAFPGSAVRSWRFAVAFTNRPRVHISDAFTVSPSIEDVDASLLCQYCWWPEQTAKFQSSKADGFSKSVVCSIELGTCGSRWGTNRNNIEITPNRHSELARPTLRLRFVAASYGCHTCESIHPLNPSNASGALGDTGDLLRAIPRSLPPHQTPKMWQPWQSTILTNRNEFSWLSAVLMAAETYPASLCHPSSQAFLQKAQNLKICRSVARWCPSIIPNTTHGQNGVPAVLSYSIGLRT